MDGMTRTSTAICIFVIAVFLLVFGALVLPTANQLAAQRQVGGPEYHPNKQLWGRTEGNIGALEWVLRECKATDERTAASLSGRLQR